MMTLQELATLRVAFKKDNPELHIKEWLEKWKETFPKSTLLDQVKAGQPKEIKVHMLRSQDDNYNELWKVVGEKKYFCRHVYGLPVWYFVCDPFGYCELDYSCNNNYIFIVCDSKGNEMFATSNIDASFPTIENVCRMEWNRIKADYPYISEDADKDFYAQAFGLGTTMNVNNWLLTFKDPELYGNEAKDYDENWIYCRSDEVARERISSFEYLGEKYAIYKITYKHRICGVEYIQYFAGSYHMGEYENWIDYYASYFDASNIGTMYSEREAKRIVREFLEEKYPKRNKFNEPLCTIINSCVGPYERIVGYVEMAEILLNRNFSRKHVAEVIEKEKNKSTFYYHGDPQIEIDYPGYMKANDYSWL